MPKVYLGSFALRPFIREHTWGASSWQPDELNDVLLTLSREFPDKPEGELVNAVVFCKGAVRRTQGVHALKSFVGSLLRNTQGVAVGRAQ